MPLIRLRDAHGAPLSTNSNILSNLNRFLLIVTHYNATLDSDIDRPYANEATRLPLLTSKLLSERLLLHLLDIAKR